MVRSRALALVFIAASIAACTQSPSLPPAVHASSFAGNDPDWHQPVASDSHVRYPAVGDFPALRSSHRHGPRLPCASIQATLDAGGVVQLPAAICKISKTLTISHSGTVVVGAGGGFSTDGVFRPASGLKWTGAPGGTILQIGNPSGVSGVSITGVGFLSNNGRAGYGLLAQGVTNSTFTGIAADAFSTAAFAFNATQNDLVSNYSIDNEPGESSGSCNTGIGLLTTGSNDRFDAGSLAYCNGAGIVLGAGSHETLNDTAAELVPYTPSGRDGFGIGLIFQCGAQNDVLNWFSATYAPYRSVVVDGDGTCGSGSGARSDTIDLYDLRDNRGYPPVVGTNTNFTCTTDQGTPCVTVTPPPNTATPRASTRRALACDGRTDDAKALQRLLDQGGTVTLPPGACAVGTTILIRHSNTYLHGGYSYLEWIGPPNGTLLQIGVGGKGPEVQGGGIDDLTLESNGGTAGVGLDLEGVEGMSFSNISADAFNRAAIATALSAQYKHSNLNTQFNTFTNYTLVNQTNAGAGILIDTACPPGRTQRYSDACRARADLAYYNDFSNGTITVAQGTGVDLEASDGNYFANTNIVESVTPSSSWQGTGIRFGCFSLSNHFQGVTMTATSPLAAGASPLSIVAYGLRSKPSGNVYDLCGGPGDGGSQALYDSVEGYAEGGPAAPPVSGDGTEFWCINTLGKPC